MTRLWCAESVGAPAPRGAPTRGRWRWHLALPVILAALSSGPAEAAVTRLRYDFGVAEIYSQDVLRIGDDSIADYITGVTLDCGLKVTTARSDSDFVYTPTYFAYANFNELDHLDHRYRGTWTMRPGPRSTFALRQGVSVNTRQSGFADLDGAGSEAGQPITGLTRRTAWELEPQWDRAQTARTTISLQGLYRSEEYDRDQFIDVDQMGLGGSVSVAVGRGQSVGGRIRGDRYRYPGSGGPQGDAYDTFLSALVTWSMAASGRFSVAADAGAFRATGGGTDPGLGPTADLSGSWLWRSASLTVGLGLGYSSGGGLSSATRSERGDITYTVEWGQGFTASLYGSHIMRDPVQKGGGDTLQGRFFALTIQKIWKPGWGLGAGVSGLRQQQEIGRALAYGEATVGFIYRPPGRAPSDGRRRILETG